MINRYLGILAVLFFVITGCGLGTSKYDDAVMDGLALMNRGKPEKALEAFNRAIQLDSERTDGFLGRANALNSLGRYSESLEDYHHVIQMNPKLANAYVNRAIAYSHLKEYEKAIADYEKGLDLDSKIDDKPGFVKRLFSNEPNTEKGIRKHLEFLKQQVKEQGS